MAMMMRERNPYLTSFLGFQGKENCVTDRLHAPDNTIRVSAFRRKSES
jgi:hypothetical protein